MSVDIVDRVFDAYTGELGQHLMRETQRRVHWMCSAVRGNTVLDVGCSQGVLPILLGREGKTVLGIDTSSEAIRSANDRLVREHVSVRQRVSFVEADLATHPLSPGDFDSVVMGEVLEHLLQPERLIETAAALLKSGGRLIVTVPFGINDHVDHKQTFYLLEPLKLLEPYFQIDEITILGRWLGLIGARRSEPKGDAYRAWTQEEVAKLETAFREIERGLVDELASLRSRLDEANGKYRASNEEIARMRREISHLESERRSLERSRAQLEQAAGTTPSASNTDSIAELDAARRNAHAAELSAARLEERLAHAEQLRELELGVRDAEIDRLNKSREALTQRVADAEARRSDAEQRQREAEAGEAHARQQLHDAQARLDAFETRFQQQEARVTSTEEHARQEIHEREGRIASLAADLAELTARHAAENERLARTELALERERSQRADAERSAEERRRSELSVLDEANQLREELSAAERAATTSRAQLADALAEAARAAQLQQQLQETQERLAQARSEQQRSSSEGATQRQLEALRREQEQQTLTRELDLQRGQKRDMERQLAQALRQLSDAKAVEARLTRQLEQERIGRVSAERKVVQTRNTLSFQLGYELIHGFKSRERLRLLPGKLLSLQKEASRRRKERREQDAPLISRAAPVAVVEKATRNQATPRNVDPPSAGPGRANALNEGRAPDRKVTDDPSTLRVACIHDEFTFASYAPECQLKPLTPEAFAEEVTTFRPDLLFVESAWRGKDDLWGKKVSHRARELVELVELCRSREIPTVFWNKEDPVHFGTFVNTAKLFDHVFTTDIDCIARYKRALGHDRVYLLPFACQPSQHNPLEKYRRKNALCFAGAYYARYPERQRDLESFAQHFSVTPRLEIFDRNYGKADPNYAFPERYRQFIVGTLPFEEIDRAYKGYQYALNLNSIKDSQTMFARRIYELLASNTTTVSNFSRGIRLMFGDLVISTDRGDVALDQIRRLEADPARARRLRLAGLRKALSEHTYAHRMRFIVSRVWGRPSTSGLPEVAVIGHARDSGELARLLAAFERQAYAHKRLIVVTSDALATTSASQLPRDAQLMKLDAVAAQPLRTLLRESAFLATLSPRDHYGRNYLLDLALATSYTKADAIGKLTRYVAGDGGLPTLQDDGAQYSAAKALWPQSAIVRAGIVASRSLGDWLAAAQRPLEHEGSVAIDEFNYCQGGALLDARALAEVDDLTDIDGGLSLRQLTEGSELLTESFAGSPRSSIPGERLAAIFKVPAGKPITLSVENGGLLVQSGLRDDAHEYLYATESWPLGELGLPHSNKLHLDASPGLNLQLALRFLDRNKQRLGHQLCAAAKNETVTAPEGTELVQLGLRVYGVGSANVAAVVLDHVAETPGHLFGRSDLLVLTNHYPSYEDLYRNGFVHRRVVDYQRQGTRVDVFRHRQGHKLAYREFDGVDVLSGGSDALATLLRSNRYRAVLVHFLDPAMWDVLRAEVRGARLLLWLHGAEVQAWHRRAFNDMNDIAREEAKAKSAKREAFWRQVLRELPPDGKLVFVSRQFAEQTFSDLGIPEARTRSEVIHNLIDGDLFAYKEKSPELRKRILSIRPFMSRKYANDLSVSAILELSRHARFTDMSFHLIGDGPLFEETVAPLRAFDNVKLERGFLTQQEIAQLHAEYGLFLCPTRDDTQGVSRDEAMSSGLVPLTSRVAAIPEFVDDDCGILADPENASQLAQGIARLYADPDLFQRMSRAAAARVRKQSCAEQTTKRELALIPGVAR